MATLTLCKGCDHPLGEGDECPRCEDVMPTYSYSPSEREAYTLSQVEAEELAVQFGFQREPHTSLIHLGEAA